MNLENRVQKLEEIVKNLSDKEESKDLAFDDFLENKYGQRGEEEEDYSYLDNLEQISHCCKAKIFFKGAGKGLWCSSCKKEVFHTEYVEEPKQEECLKCNQYPFIEHTHEPKQEECHCGKNGHAINSINCPVHGYYTVPKQSTSLKEEVRKLVKECVYVGELSSEKISDKILSLIQSHLLKEIRPESHNHVHSIVTYCNSCKRYGGNMPDDLVCGNCGKDTDTWTYYPLKDIIKIINNIN